VESHPFAGSDISLERADGTSRFRANESRPAHPHDSLRVLKGTPFRSNGLWLLATESHPHMLGHKILDFETLACDQETVLQLG